MKKVLQIDEKWSVEYDSAQNDRPTAVLRHGEPHTVGTDSWNNDSVAMFYALLQHVEALKSLSDCRKWWYFPIEMPLTPDGQGPAILGKDPIGSITYEVWDRLCCSWATFDNLPDAINDAMRRNAIMLELPDTRAIAPLTPSPLDGRIEAETGDYRLREDLLTVIANAGKSVHWNTASDRAVAEALVERAMIEAADAVTDWLNVSSHKTVREVLREIATDPEALARIIEGGTDK
jgi:hypothetical protein